MTVFWLWVSAGCLACALLGFSAVRVGARILTAGGVTATAPVPERQRPRQPRALQLVPSAPEPAEPHTAEPEPEPAPDLMPAPTAPRPEAEKLALWATQVKAGERKMSVATDGCRVTWNRTCKHGHPTWLVYLGYL